MLAAAYAECSKDPRGTETLSRSGPSAPISPDRVLSVGGRLAMVRKLGGYLMALVVLGMAFPGLAWAAEAVTKAACGCCCPPCCG